MVTHWRLTYPENLKRAYYVTVGLITLVLLAAFGYVNGKGFFQSRSPVGAELRIITFRYAELGPPPSLTGDAITPATGTTPKVPVVGIPKPVPDPKAVTQTISTQLDLVGSSPLNRVPDGTEVRVKTDIPVLGTYVPHNVKPQLVYWKNPDYPESAKLLGIEGRVYLQLLLDTDGTVMQVVVAKGSGNAALDTAAVISGFQAKFTPAQQGEQKVRVWIGIPVEFDLDR